jgi:hypothetical protein
MTRTTLFAVLAFAVAALVLPGAEAKCADLASLRTDYVATSFDEAKIDGFWYEIAYHDLAQVGESCQCFNKTVTAPEVDEKFGFTFKNPNSLSLVYTRDEAAAVYSKAMGSTPKALLPTVIIDVGVSADDSSAPYETIIEYTCLDEGAVTLYQEVKIGARTPTVSVETMKALEQTVLDAGIEVHGDLNYVDQTGCEYNAR